MTKQLINTKSGTLGNIDYSKPLGNSRHERFCQVYVKDPVRCLNNSLSYQMAYPTVKSANVAKAAGCRLLTQVNVACRIQQLQKEVSDKAGVTAEMILDELKKIGFSNIHDLHDGLGKPKGIDSLSRDVTAAIESIQHTKTGIKYVMHDKLGAIEKMAKHIGFYSEDNKQKATTLAALMVKFL